MMTSNGTIKSGMYQQPHIGSYKNFKLKLTCQSNILQILKMKTTSYGRRPQPNSGISKYLLIGSYSNGRLPPIEDDLKTLRVEYLSHHLSDHTQILNLSLNDPGRQPQVQRI
jgi:hypothetical protein